MAESPAGTDHIRAQRARDRLTVVVMLVALIVLTWLLAHATILGLGSILAIAMLWVILGYVAFFAAAHAYTTGDYRTRPDLQVLHGVPAWAFFVGGAAVMVGVSAFFLASANMRVGLTLTGVSVAFLACVYPRPFSLRVAWFALAGFLIASVGVIFF